MLSTEDSKALDYGTVLSAEENKAFRWYQTKLTSTEGNKALDNSKLQCFPVKIANLFNR